MNEPKRRLVQLRLDDDRWITTCLRELKENDIFRDDLDTNNITWKVLADAYIDGEGIWSVTIQPDEIDGEPFILPYDV